ncbi:MAG: DUF4910 domain-containing protein [Alphaproteobacteria bacterium]|nr:DUF4910 domain-containing protein [Alphaproteobacteria bacterium]
MQYRREADGRVDRESDKATLQDTLERLLYIPRSIAGPGVRETHDILSELIPLDRLEVKTGAQAFDWIVPQEWTLHEAYVADTDGHRYFDAAETPLRLINYAVQFRGRVSRDELLEHLHVHADRPDAIPYVTSYYKPRWGFCCTAQERDNLPEGPFDIVVDTTLADGALTLSEIVIGSGPCEMLFSAYTCHPGMIHDELAAPVALALLGRRLMERPPSNIAVRIVFCAETIGTICYLAEREALLRRNVFAGVALSNIARPEPFTFKLTRQGETAADRMARALAAVAPHQVKLNVFKPWGGEERQYNSPGLDLPVLALSRGETYFPEYHSSHDNLERANLDAILETIDLLEKFVWLANVEGIYERIDGRGEPRLGPRGLYPDLGRTEGPSDEMKSILWLLNQCDGDTWLSEIVAHAGLPLDLMLQNLERLMNAGLLRK